MAADCRAWWICCTPRTAASPARTARITGAARQRAGAAIRRVGSAAAGCALAAGGSGVGADAAGEARNVAALRNLDQDRIGLARDQIVALQRATQPPGFGPHHRVRLGVEAPVALEHGGGDGVAFQTVRTPGEGLLHEVAQKAARSLGDHELGAAEDTRQLITHLVGRWQRQRFPALAHGPPVPFVHGRSSPAAPDPALAARVPMPCCLL